MPLSRYFSFVGGVLLALLFVLDACFPELPVVAKAKVYPPVIRIYSDEKWPERIVYDTNLPTIVPVPAATAEAIVHAPEKIADASSGAKEHGAFAMLPVSVDRLQALQRRNAGTETATSSQSSQETRAGAEDRDGTATAICST